MQWKLCFAQRLNRPGGCYTIKTIDQKKAEISKLEQKNQTIRAQYDSTLLEKIAGQPRQQSINQVSAEKAKQELEQNSIKIALLNQEISTLKTGLIAKPESVNFLSLLSQFYLQTFAVLQRLRTSSISLI